MTRKLQKANPSRPVNFSKRERALAEAVQQDDRLECYFKQAPIVSAIDKSTGGLLPAEAAQGQELVFSSDKEVFEMHHAVVESTGTALYSFPSVSASGLEIALDANVTDGVTAYELSNGILSSSKSAVTVGSDEDYEFEVKFKIDDVSDLEEIFVGFRKAEAYQADPDSYDEMAAFHIGETGGTVADGQINIATILNNGATTYTDTTEVDWADGEEKTIKVLVRKSGQCLFYLNGSLPAAYPSFSFDSGEVIVPFFYADNTSGSTTGDPGVSITHWKLGKRGLTL